VESSENLWISVTAALAIGVVIGVVVAGLARRLSGGVGGSSQRQLESLQLRFEEYQQEVAGHFKTTAGLVARLNRDYQDIQQHLTQSAMELAPDDISRQRLLAAMQQSTTASLEDKGPAAFDSLEPPRDYAPKSEDSPGTLSEDFSASRKHHI